MSAIRVVPGRLFLLFALAACPGAPRHGVELGARKWATPWGRIDNPARDRDPCTPLVLAALAARKGMRVADVGAGAGYLTFKVARLVGPTGRVLATDVDPELVRHIRREAARRRVPTIEARLVTPSAPRLEEAGYDLIFAVNVFLFWRGSEREGRALLRAFRRALRPGGRLVLFQDNLLTGPSRRTGCLGKCVSLGGAETASLARAEGFRVRRLSAAPPHHVEPGTRPGYLLVLDAGPGPGR